MNKKIEQQMAEQPIMAQSVPHFIKEMLQEKEHEVVKPAEDRDELNLLYESGSWKILKKYLREKQKRLEQMTAQSVRSDSFDLQNVGFRYLIFDQVREALEDVIRFVEQPAQIDELNKTMNDEGPTTN